MVALSVIFAPRSQQLDSLALQAVIVVQSVGVDQRYIALTVLGDDLLSAGLDLVGQLRKVSACLGERRCVIVDACTNDCMNI